MKAEYSEKFKKIYELESDTIFRFCLVRVSDRNQALDLTQETFLRLWQTISDNQKIRNEKAFLFTVAHRLIIDWYRKKKSFSLDKMLDDEVPFDVADEKAREKMEAEIDGKILLDKINEISPTSRESVYLRFVEDLAPAEIAEILGCSINVVSVRISRGIEELRKIANHNIEK